MDATTLLAIIALVIIISTLYFLKDTILEALSGGKSFMPAEMKPFKSGRKNNCENKEKIDLNKTWIHIIDLVCLLVFIYIIYKTFIEVSKILNW